MVRLDMEKVINGLSRLVPLRKGDEPTVAPAPQPEGEMPRASDAKDAGALYPKLEAVPGPAGPWNRHALVLTRERVKGKGEDAFLAAEAANRFLMGVFDGCGGSGAKVYEAFGGHTGAWVASRATALAVREWFLDGPEGADEALYEGICAMLAACKAAEPAGQLLMGSLSREFPTTAAMFSQRGRGDLVDFRWCGDSRCYVLDAGGLHQVTTDDAAVTDAMRNLREDAPMTNVACASRPFVLHSRSLRVKSPALLIAATDGCFGYLPSPMAFEALLLETLGRASDFEGWRRGLDARLRDVSGDDYTLVAWPHGFKSYRAMKRTLGKRLALLHRRYPQAHASEETLEAQWQSYKADYEALLPREDTQEKRG